MYERSSEPMVARETTLLPSFLVIAFVSAFGLTISAGLLSL
jgi:hypothetical protein